MADKKDFTFKISMSVLNDLGRRLYRSFETVLGEAISNSWDANADNVWIYIDKEKGNFAIKDDGDGMDAYDFQEKFLKIGYSKRKDGETHSPPPKNRPYIGRKGIGKLALLSCAENISIISKKKGEDYVGGVINNSGLDTAITSDLVPEDYPLGEVDMNYFKRYTKEHEKGTIIYFQGMKEGIKNSLVYVRKMIALYFRFSLIDKSFNIFVEDKPITLDDLDEFVEHTEFLWVINDLEDPYITRKLKYLKKNAETDTNLLEPAKKLKSELDVRGFIASVRKPRDLKITNTDERIGVDLFVNGRLRERDIIKHIPTQRVVESYIYGQIHFDGLDDEKDRFATSREGIIAGDEKFQRLLGYLKTTLVMPQGLFEDWDAWRVKHHKEGDSENTRISEKTRKAVGLYDVVSREFETPKDPNKPRKRGMVDQWVDELENDASYSFSSFAECFISENLVRKHITQKKIALSKEAMKEISDFKEKETKNKKKGNISIEIRKAPTGTSYLSMDGLANLVDKPKDPAHEAALSRDANEYKPIRDALMHTALLTDEAKKKLTSVFENIKGRVKTLLSKG